MNRKSRSPGACTGLGDRLVDYVDGALPAAEVARVQRHLADCGECRRETAALRRSLAMAQSIWTTAAEGRSAAAPRKVRPGWLVGALGGVAAVVVIAAGIFLAARPAENRNFAAGRTERTDSRHTESAPEEIAVEDLDIEAFIRRQEQSARLAASVRFLAETPVGPEDTERAERYLRETYGVEATNPRASRSGEL